MTSPDRPLTPNQAYDKARADVMAQHKYTTEGVHAVCSCGEVSTTEAVGNHIEELAEKAGHDAREKEVARLVAEHEASETARKKKEAAEVSARLAQLRAEEEAAGQ